MINYEDDVKETMRLAKILSLENPDKWTTKEAFEKRFNYSFDLCSLEWGQGKLEYKKEEKILYFDMKRGASIELDNIIDGIYEIQKNNKWVKLTIENYEQFIISHGQGYFTWKNDTKVRTIKITILIQYKVLWKFIWNRFSEAETQLRREYGDIKSYIEELCYDRDRKEKILNEAQDYFFDTI